MVMGTVTTGRKLRWGLVDILVLVFALVPVLWVVSLSFKTKDTLTDGYFIPQSWTWQNYADIFQTSEFLLALVNSIGIAIISTVIAVVLGTMAAYAIARLEFPGKQLLVGLSLLIAMFPQVSLVTPLFNIERNLALFDTWPGLILPYITFALPLSIYTLSAFFREIPWELEKAAKMDGATAGPGVPEGDRAAGRAGCVHHRDPGVHLLLERLPVRHLADVDHGVAHGRRRRCRSSPGPRSSRTRPGR